MMIQRITQVILELCINPEDDLAIDRNFAGDYYVDVYNKEKLPPCAATANLDNFQAWYSCLYDVETLPGDFGPAGLIETREVEIGGCGCKNEGALNFTSAAVADYPGFCKFPQGCTDKEADNYDPQAVVDDNGTCIFPRIAEVHGGTHANATGHIQSIGGNAVSTLLDGLSAATTIAESASAIIGGSGPSAKANVAAHTRGANTYRLGTAARTRSTTHQNKMHYGTLGTSNTHFDGYAYGKKKDDESTEGAHGADVSLVSPHFSGGYASVGSGYGKDYHAYAGQKESLRATGYKLPYSIPVEAITNQYYHHYSGR